MHRLTLFIVLLIPFQEKPKKNNEFEERVNKAIDKGSKYLLEHVKEYNQPIEKSGEHLVYNRVNELVLYTLIHAKIDLNTKEIQTLLKRVLARRPDKKSTYTIALEIIALVSLDQKTYKERLYEAAQVLIDRQGADGGWYYYDRKISRHEDLKDLYQPFDDSKLPDVAKPKNNGNIKNNQTGQHQDMRKTRFGLEGDNSCSQYAALALMALHEAGITIPKDVAENVRKYWISQQRQDGGWNYSTKNRKPAYGSMTVGGISSLAIMNKILNYDSKKDGWIKKGVEWLDKNWSVDKNPNSTMHATNTLYYYLFGLERVGSMLGIEKIGNHSWYKEGAEFILSKQESDGSWNGLDGRGKSGKALTELTVVDTCFAILFLRKSTEQLLFTTH